MKRWAAIVPLKPVNQRKLRLAERLSPAEREQLAERMLDRLLLALASTPEIASVEILARDPVSRPGVGWIEDRGEGLNGELTRLTTNRGPARLLVISADLPLIAPADISALIGAAEQHGCAIAADRHRSGSNAVALRGGGSFRFAFGPGSLEAHCASYRDAAVVERTGLAWDIDTPEDLAAARARGATGLDNLAGV